MGVRPSLLLAALLPLAALLLAGALLPVRYEATARVLLPRPPFDAAAFADKAAAYGMTVGAESRSRVLSLHHAGADPARAAAAVNAFLQAHVPEGMLVVDEASVPFASGEPGPRMRATLGAAGLLLLLFSIPVFSRLKTTREPPDRAVVQYALRFAQLGQKTLLVDTGTRLRVVLSSDAAAALGPELEILARLASGALTVARTL